MNKEENKEKEMEKEDFDELNEGQNENELFSASNDDDNTNYYPDYGASSKRETSFKDLNCPGYDKFLVPIYWDKDKSMYVGNGVIVGQYLVTVADVGLSKDKKSKYENMYYGVCVDSLNRKFWFEKIGNNIVYDGREMIDENGTYDDLLIYELSDNHDAFKCNEKDLEPSLELASCCFEFSGEQRSNNDGWILPLDSATTEKSEPLRKNCFKFRARFPYYEGKEGCALYRGNVLYGVLVKKIRYQDDLRNEKRDYMALDARYIKMRIEEYESKRNK